MSINTKFSNLLSKSLCKEVKRETDTEVILKHFKNPESLYYDEHSEQ